MNVRFPPRRILVPVDFSWVSAPSLSHAKELARRFRASVDVVYVQEPPPMTEGMLAAAAYHESGSKEAILRRLRQIAGKGPRLHVSQGDAVVAILRMAEELGSDLIVMGTHGATGLLRLWLGSVAEDVVRRSTIPVLVLHGRPAKMRSVLAPVDFNSHSEQGVRVAAKVAAAFGAPMTVLHIIGPADPDPTGSLESVRKRLSAATARRARVKTKWRRGYPTEEILKAGRSAWIVLVAQRKSMLRDWVLGTTVERVLRFSSTPVLTVPAPGPR